MILSAKAAKLMRVYTVYGRNLDRQTHDYIFIQMSAFNGFHCNRKDSLTVRVSKQMGVLQENTHKQSQLSN